MADEQFIQGWARDIKAQTGKTIPTAKLVQLYKHYTKRSPELMQTHGTTNEQGVAEADETSWTANSAQFRKEEDMSWTFKITIEPNADVNKGRGRREVTKIVSGQSMDAAKKKIREYYLRNGWEVVGIEQVMPEMDTYPHPKSKEGKKLMKAIRDPNAPEVKPQSLKKTVEDATKILNKEFQKSVKEDQIEETSEDPIAKIDALFKDK